MSRYQKDLGDFGERVAENFYRENGYVILAKNYTVRGGEIDLIVESPEWLVFVEVKTRSNLNYGYPSEAINHKKIQHMCRAAGRYIGEHPTKKEIRFDAIEVLVFYIDGAPELKEINHIPNIL